MTSVIDRITKKPYALTSEINFKHNTGKVYRWIAHDIIDHHL